jgi:hypothetical protein
MIPERSQGEEEWDRKGEKPSVRLNAKVMAIDRRIHSLQDF